jgi:hypothetical protein
VLRLNFEYGREHMIVSVKGLLLGWRKGCFDWVFDYLVMYTMVMEAIELPLAMDMRWVGMTEFLGQD